MTYLPPPDLPGAPVDPPRVAFAITRRFGPAVERNRIRRRLRAAIAELSGRSPSPVASGAYLLTVRPEALTRTFAQLTQDLEHAFDKLSTPSSPSTRAHR